MSELRMTPRVLSPGSESQGCGVLLSSKVVNNGGPRFTVLGLRKGEESQRGRVERWQVKGCLKLEGARWWVRGSGVNIFLEK
jgi:hypothetical protein